MVSPALEDAARERKKIRNLRAQRARYFHKDGLPIAEAEALLSAQQKQLTALEKSVSGASLTIPEDLRPEEGRDVLYFQKMLAELCRSVRARGVEIDKKSASLGFPADAPPDSADELLARLAVARRFFDAAVAARVRSVSRVEQPSIREVERPEVSVRLEEIPMRATCATDERGLIRLLQEISRPGAFLALKGLRIEVREPDSGVFHAALELAGVRTRKAAAPEAVREERPEQPAGGTTVPLRPRRF
jgi:hypothetical protein